MLAFITVYFADLSLQQYIHVFFKQGLLNNSDNCNKMEKYLRLEKEGSNAGVGTYGIHYTQLIIIYFS